MSIIQKIKNFFSPKKRFYKAASKERPYDHWITKLQTPNAHLSQLQIIRARANSLYWNEPFIRGAVDLIINRMIGPGSIPQARTDNEVFNREIEELFKQWAENADVYGQYHFGDIERLINLKLFLDGGCFIKKIIDNRRKNPFCLEIIEYERLASGGTAVGNNQMLHGVEFNPDTGKVVAYHFYTKFSQETAVPIGKQIKRVSADSVIHYSPFRRPGQLLGIPLLAPVIPYAMNLSEIIEAELIAKKIEACFGVAIKTNDLYGRIHGATENEEGEREIEIAPGMVEFLGPNEELQVIDPKRPGRNFKDFVYFILEGVARGLGLSLEQITGDKSQVNYSSTRHSELELRDYLKSFRAADERYFLRPIWRLFVEYSILAGLIHAPQYSQKPAQYQKHEWIFKGYDWVDPFKEIKAKTQELLIGATTLSEICAQKGKDWQEVIKQRAREKDFINSLGLSDISQTTQVKANLREKENGNTG